MDTRCEFCPLPSKADVEQIRHIYEANFPASERKPFEAFGLGNAASSYRCLVARSVASPGGICAFALLLPLPQVSRVFLEYLAVGTQWQGQGIGQIVFRTASSFAGEDGLVWEVEPPVPDDLNHQANRRLRFYEKQGARLIEHSQGYAMPDYSSQGGNALTQSVPLRLMQLPLEAQPDHAQTCALIRAIYDVAYSDAASLRDEILISVQEPAQVRHEKVNQ